MEVIKEMLRMPNFDLSALAAPVVAAAIVAGVISMAGILINILVSGHREQRNRRRETYAKAFAVCVSYREFVFVVRRRNGKKPEAERARISAEMKKVQEEMAYFDAWMDTESPYVGGRYRKLVAATRDISGSLVGDAWKTPPITTDGEMKIKGIDLSGISQFERRYLDAVRDHLSLWPTWLTRSLRAVRLRDWHD